MRELKKCILSFCAVLLFGGCLNNRYIAPVTAFNSATTQTVSTISAFYSSRNAYELQIYLDDVAGDPSVALVTTDANGNPTPLGKPVFSQASIKARLDALSLVGVYSSRLYDLANTSAPSDFATAATTLGTNLSKLDTTFQGLGAGDATANAYVGPITSLIGTIGKMYLNGKSDELVKEAILNGGPQVNTILSQIKDDMDKIFSVELITGANDQLASAIVAYNHDRSSLTYDQRVARLADIQTLSAAASAAAASAPSQLVSSMLTANQALLKSASAPKQEKPLTLASLNSALSSWTGQIQTLASQIQPLIK